MFDPDPVEISAFEGRYFQLAQRAALLGAPIEWETAEEFLRYIGNTMPDVYQDQFYLKSNREEVLALGVSSETLHPEIFDSHSFIARQSTPEDRGLTPIHAADRLTRVSTQLALFLTLEEFHDNIDRIVSTIIEEQD